MYESLLVEAEQAGIEVIEKRFKSNAKGLCKGNRIGISKRIKTTAERSCVLAEELGHYHTTIGNILDQTDVRNRKQERRAREWGYKRLIPLDRIIDAYLARAQGRHEIAEFLGVTERFLQSALDRLQERYGVATYHNDYLITFDPLQVFEPYSDS